MYLCVCTCMPTSASIFISHSYYSSPFSFRPWGHGLRKVCNKLHLHSHWYARLLCAWNGQGGDVSNPWLEQHGQSFVELQLRMCCRYLLIHFIDFADEHVRKASGHDINVDWWALGVLVFELLAGKAPFESAYPFQKLGGVMGKQNA